MLPMFLAMIDQTIVTTALPAIAVSLGSVERVSWVVVGYLIATTIAAPVYGRFGDLLGRRRLMFVALILFTSASVLCAFATSIEFLTFARVLQGLGGGGLMTLSQALIGEAVPPRERARYQGYLAANAVTASALGPVVGGFLTEHLGWMSVFLVNVPLGIVALLLTFRLRASPGSGAAFQLDPLGLVLFIMFVAPLLLALQQAQHFQWQSLPAILALAALGIGSAVLLFWQEKRTPSPLLPIGLLSQPAIWRSDAMAACHGATFVSLLTFVPIYLRVARGMSAGEIGLVLLPITVCIGVGSMITGQIVSRTGKTAVVPSFGLIVAFATLLGLAVWAPQLTTLQLTALLGVNALFMGTVMSVVQVTVQSVAGPKRLGAAAASVQFSRSVGAAFGTAMVAAVLFGLVAAQDPRAAELFASSLEHGPGILASLPAAQQAMVQEEIALAFQAAFLTIAMFAAGALALAWSIPVRRI
jgi:EmrB/QacA subfamily drug resistance transporter